MDTQSTPAASSGSIDDLFKLTLADGLPVQVEGKTIRYKGVKLRETAVADERIAEREAERLVNIGGAWKMVVSDSAFSFGMTVRHIDAFLCYDTAPPMVIQGSALIDAELVGKLSSHDLHLIEQRIFLITLAAEVRYGNMTQAEFDAVLAGGKLPGGAQSPQSAGQAANVGSTPEPAQPGPQMLADYAGAAAGGASARHG
jgi:phage FluMu protein gp41